MTLLFIHGKSRPQHLNCYIFIQSQRHSAAAAAPEAQTGDMSATENKDPHQTEENESFLGFDVPPLRPVLRVLSLFDGIGTAYHVLKKLGLFIDKYYSSEVDGKALNLLKYKYSDKIEMLGDVQNISSSLLRSLKINFLIGGSPCSELSLVNPQRKGLQGITLLIIADKEATKLLLTPVTLCRRKWKVVLRIHSCQRLPSKAGWGGGLHLFLGVWEYCTYGTSNKRLNVQVNKCWQ